MRTRYIESLPKTRGRTMVRPYIKRYRTWHAMSLLKIVNLIHAESMSIQVLKLKTNM